MLQAILWNARITCGMIKALDKESQLSIIQHSSTSLWSILVLQLPSSSCLFGHFMLCTISEGWQGEKSGLTGKSIQLSIL